MRELIEYLAKNIVDKPKSVKIEVQDQDGALIIKMSVDQEDMGKVIGKNGRIIKAIRNLLKIKAIRENKKAFLQLEDLS